MAVMTIPRATNSAFQSKLLTTSSSSFLKAKRVYKSRLAGNMITERRVLIAVMETERAKSALNMEANL
jgi:hypothetical protein